MSVTVIEKHELFKEFMDEYYDKIFDSGMRTGYISGCQDTIDEINRVLGENGITDICVKLVEGQIHVEKMV